MSYVFRALALTLALGLLFNLSLAQVSQSELPAGAADNLRKPGARESHQGPDNPMQGNRSRAEGRFGGPDAYGSESFRDFMDKAETRLNDPQWQLKLDLQHPKRIVVDYPNGTSKEYWYVMFRVVNDNTRPIKSTTIPQPHSGDADPSRLAEPLRVQDTSRGDREGVPANAHLDFELHVFTRDIERDPWDTIWPEEPEDEVLSREALAQRRANMRRVHRPVSSQHVLQRIAASEGMYEWMGNHDFINEPVMMLHPLSDFQRQVGLVHELTAPDYSGPRCLAYRTVIVDAEGRSEAMRYVAVYGDNSFAGFFGEGDELPSGARLVNSTSDPMWGRLTVPRYQPGDAIDRFGRALNANDPGYLQARRAGGQQGSTSSYGVLSADHPAVNTPVRVPHVRLYREGDRVLVNYDTRIPHADLPNATYRINGKLVSAADSRYDEATEIDGGTQIFGSDVVGRPVKQVDQRGRAIRRYVVTYQAGDVLTQAEWDIYRRRLGPGILSRYSDIDGIVGRPLTHNDPVVGLPKIKLGFLRGDSAARGPEVISRGIDTGRRGPRGEVILEASDDFATGRLYDPRRISPEHFQRDPDGEFTTNRVAPLPQNHGLRAGEEYVYAPLGQAGQNAAPVPKFDQYGAWKDYRDEFSGERIPLVDDEGELIRDMQDQLLYLKEYEYEYIYMYEYQPLAQDDEGFRGSFGGEQFRLRETEIEFAVYERDGATTAAPLARLIFEDRMIRVPTLRESYRHVNERGIVSYLSAAEYQQATGEAPGEDVARTMIVVTEEVAQPVAVGVYHDGVTLSPGQRAESWEEARERVETANGRIERRTTLAFVERFRTQGGEGPRPDEMHEGEIQEALADLDGLYKTWSRWTVPPPLVYRDDRGEWQVVTRFADQLGPGRRWDNKDAPRFLTRFVSEKWGVAIFENVGTDWDFANVYVRGLRDTVSNAGLKRDTEMTQFPNPVAGGAPISKAFFKPRLVSQEWIYRARYERLGDEFDAYRDVVRRTRSFWYLDTSAERREVELGN